MILPAVFILFLVILGVLASLFDKYRKWGHKIVRSSDHVSAKFKLVWKWAPRLKKKYKCVNHCAMAQFLAGTYNNLFK